MNTQNIESQLRILSEAKELEKTYNSDVVKVILGTLTGIIFHNGLMTVSYSNCQYLLLDGTNELESHEHNFNFDIGLKTPKGYKSKKSIGISIVDEDNVTIEEAGSLIQFNEDFKINTFDPFYAQHEAERKNASAWNYVARNYLTEERWG